MSSFEIHNKVMYQNRVPIFEVVLKHFLYISSIMLKVLNS